VFPCQQTLNGASQAQAGSYSLPGTTHLRYYFYVILLVEDDVHARRAFSNLLRRRGFEVLEAGDAKNALSLLSEWMIDLVITDLSLPDASGFDLVDMIHAQFPKTPLIVISGYFSQSTGEVILGGMAEFVQKPIDIEVLVGTMQRMLSTSKARAQQS
jgi:DNA-binding NtrC family response regulator